MAAWVLRLQLGPTKQISLVQSGDRIYRNRKVEWFNNDAYMENCPFYIFKCDSLDSWQEEREIILLGAKKNNFVINIINPIPILLLNCWEGIILAPAFILLRKIMKLRIIFEFYFRKKNSENKSSCEKNKSQDISDMAAFSIKRKPQVGIIFISTRAEQG